MSNLTFKILTFIKVLLIKTRDFLIEYFSFRKGDIYSSFVKKLIIVIFLAFMLSGLTILLFLFISSLSTPLTKVPDVRNKDILTAINLLQNAGLNIKVESVYKDNIDKFIVFDQFPKSGIIVKKGRVINIIASMGKDVYKMPNFVSMKRKDAIDIMNKMGILYSIQTIQSDDYDLDIVISQDIPEGTMVERKTKVNLLVNSDIRKDEYRVPDFTGKPADVVINELYKNNITPILIKKIVTNKLEDGIILAQSVSPNSILPYNSEIFLNIGIYGDDDLEREKFKYYIFNYYVPFPAETDTEYKGEKILKIIAIDELNQINVLFNRAVNFGENIRLLFKSYGKTKLTIFLDNILIKEFTYE